MARVMRRFYNDADMERFEYLRGGFGCEPAAKIAMEVDSKAAFRASFYKVPDDHQVNDTRARSSGLNATVLFDVATTSGALRLVEADPPTACEPLRNEGLDGAAVLVRRGECAFEVKQSHAADAGAAAIVVSNDRMGLLPMSASSPAAVVDEVAAVMVTSRAGSTLRQLARDAAHVRQSLWIRFSGNDKFVQGWRTIQDLIDNPSVRGSPCDALFLRPVRSRVVLWCLFAVMAPQDAIPAQALLSTVEGAPPGQGWRLRRAV